MRSCINDKDDTRWNQETGLVDVGFSMMESLREDEAFSLSFPEAGAGNIGDSACVCVWAYHWFNISNHRSASGDFVKRGESLNLKRYCPKYLTAII